MSKKVQFKDLFNYTCLEIPWLLTSIFSFVSGSLIKSYFYWEIFFTSRLYPQPCCGVSNDPCWKGDCHTKALEREAKMGVADMEQ